MQPCTHAAVSRLFMYRSNVPKCSDPPKAVCWCLSVTVAVTNTKLRRPWSEDARIGARGAVQHMRLGEYHGCHADARRIAVTADFCSYAWNFLDRPRAIPAAVFG
jgi:hypothetical protein